MKSNLKKLTQASTISLIAGYAGMVSAHDMSNQYLDIGAGKVDYYQVTCFNDGNGNAQRLDIQEHVDTVGGATLSLQVLKGWTAKNTTDPVPGDSDYSPLKSVYGGNGVYHVLVDKKNWYPRQYDIRYHCMTSGNVHTGTLISLKQNN